ncbi:hypothetical protein MNBD_GAMMA04-506 [hydrothermal vent metagenome]|uniref:Ice-binding protein C-terminal domain-containing protein n=1 Tax=hydrothermal vent metagenome TaxID=652676 RepID=A0A3B0VZY0_9ZZZZ
MKNLVSIKKAGFVASLLLASSLVSANNTYSLGDITAGTTDYTIDTDTGGIPTGAFTDQFNFTLTDGNFFNALATSSIASISEFTDITLGNMSGQVYDISGIFSVAEFTASAVGQSTFLNAGSYFLEIKGIASANSTGYTLNTVTSPVPEPSTIALMLGGLGMIGFMAARRRNQNA